MTIENCWYKDVCKLPECSSACVRFRCMNALFSRSRLPEARWKQFPLIAFEDDLEAYTRLAEIKSNIENFIKSGRNVYIFSNTPGNGKTSWAIRLMSAYFDKIWDYGAFECRGIYLNVTSFLQLAKDNINSPSHDYYSLLNNLVKCDVVIWDDIGIEHTTEYEYKLLFNLIDQRIMAQKSNIYTSNISDNECTRVLGERLSSRILGNCEIFEFRDEDKRGINTNG